MNKTARVINEANTLKQQFAKKIKTVSEILSLIDPFPRNKKVIMCHGTFDVVHPGHVRQLIYAKSKGDVLIVSLTSDKYVNKGPLRPYVPQELRALNLAAFEIVDHVIIDQNPTPIENILALKPNFFVKGFEYSLKGIHPKTKEEIEALSSYGGQIVYSPGDIVYSSTQLLSIHKPKLSLDQLYVLMSAEAVTFEMLRETINKFKKISVHVVGDVIVDKYSKCTLLGPAQKSAAFSVRHDDEDLYVGGAGIVAKHLKSLGANVTLTTVVGEDELADFVINDLAAAGIQVNALKDASRPTTLKERFITDGGRLLLQVDKIDNHPVPEKILADIRLLVRQTPTQVVICSDFRHGIFNSETIPLISQAIPMGALKIADSQVSNRWGNILDFQWFDLITPNEREARFALGDQDTTIRPLAQTLYNKAMCRYLILKLGENGIMTYRSPGMETREYFYIDSFATDLVDAIGAGDALLAAATSALVATKDIVQASILGNLCAAIQCAKLGNSPITAKELYEKTYELENQA